MSCIDSAGRGRMKARLSWHLMTASGSCLGITTSFSNRLGACSTLRLGKELTRLPPSLSRRYLSQVLPRDRCICHYDARMH